MVKCWSNGLEYPYYSIRSEVWDAKREEYFPKHIKDVQTREEAIKIVKKLTVDADRPQIKIEEEYEDECETIAIKDAVDDNECGYIFWNPLTNEDIE